MYEKGFCERSCQNCECGSNRISFLLILLKHMIYIFLKREREIFEVGPWQKIFCPNKMTAKIWTHTDFFYVVHLFTLIIGSFALLALFISFLCFFVKRKIFFLYLMLAFCVPFSSKLEACVNPSGIKWDKKHIFYVCLSTHACHTRCPKNEMERSLTLATSEVLPCKLVFIILFKVVHAYMLFYTSFPINFP